MRLAQFFDAHADPWVSMEMPVAARTFGMACDRDFPSYLEGPSRVSIQSIEELCAWLRGCEAMDDQTLFFQSDYWQHPVTFEQIRKGDCEDHALWAWRQLHRLNVPARFVAGLWRDIPHTWVICRNDGVDTLIETTAKSSNMLLPLEDARPFYCPALAVDRDCRTYVYQGFPRFRAASARHRG